MNIWEKLAKKKNPAASLADTIEALLRERPHLDSLDILFAVQTAGPSQRTSAAQMMEAIILLQEQNRIVRLGNGYCAVCLSDEKVTADL